VRHNTSRNVNERSGNDVGWLKHSVYEVSRLHSDI
jgi:hypothetical protein